MLLYNLSNDDLKVTYVCRSGRRRHNLNVVNSNISQFTNAYEFSDSIDLTYIICFKFLDLKKDRYIRVTNTFLIIIILLFAIWYDWLLVGDNFITHTGTLYTTFPYFYLLSVFRFFINTEDTNIKRL